MAFLPAWLFDFAACLGWVQFLSAGRGLAGFHGGPKSENVQWRLLPKPLGWSVVQRVRELLQEKSIVASLCGRSAFEWGLYGTD